MGKLTETLKQMGYTFLEAARPQWPVPQLRVRSPRGQELVLGRDEQPCFFPGDTDGIPDNDWTGEDGVRTTACAVYCDYYALDREGCCRLLHACSCRVWEYLAAQRARIGLVGVKVAAPEQFFVLETHDIGLGVGILEAGRYADGRFVAQAVSAGGGPVLRMHFRHLPERGQAQDGALIALIEQGLMDGTLTDPEDSGWLDPHGTLADNCQRLRTESGATPLGK